MPQRLQRGWQWNDVPLTVHCKRNQSTVLGCANLDVQMHLAVPFLRAVIGKSDMVFTDVGDFSHRCRKAPYSHVLRRVTASIRRPPDAFLDVDFCNLPAAALAANDKRLPWDSAPPFEHVAWREWPNPWPVASC